LNYQHCLAPSEGLFGEKPVEALQTT